LNFTLEAAGAAGKEAEADMAAMKTVLAAIATASG